MIRPCSPVLAVFLLIGTSLPVQAQDATVDEVQQHFETGASLYFEQKYDEAIVEFQKGYSLYPDPLFLYNISMAHGKMGRVDESLAVAELARTSGLDEPDATQNLARIVALKDTKVAQSVASNVRVNDVPKAPPFSPAEVSERPFDWKFWAGTGAATAGVASVVVGAVIDSGLNDTISAYEAAARAGEQETYTRLQQTIDDDQTKATVFYAAGAVLVAVGAGLVVWSLVDEDASVAVTLSPNGGQVFARW